MCLKMCVCVCFLGQCVGLPSDGCCHQEVYTRCTQWERKSVSSRKPGTGEIGGDAVEAASRTGVQHTYTHTHTLWTLHFMRLRKDKPVVHSYRYLWVMVIISGEMQLLKSEWKKDKVCDWIKGILKKEKGWFVIKLNYPNSFIYYCLYRCNKHWRIPKENLLLRTSRMRSLHVSQTKWALKLKI